MADNVLPSSSTSISQQGQPTEVIVVPLVLPTMAPAAAAPADTAPPMLDTKDYGLEIQVALWTLLLVSGAFLSLRLFCKISKHITWWDDILLAVSWLFLMGSTILTNQAVLRGYGGPFSSIDPTTLVGTVKLGLSSATFAIAATGLSKTSFAMTLLRLTDGRVRQLVLAILIAINVVMGVTGLFVWIQCIPLEKSWDSTVPGACWDPTVNLYWGRTASILSGAMDFLLAMLPWTILRRLRMKKREKIGVAAAMSLGVGAGITAFIKARFLLDTRDPNISNYGHTLNIVVAAEPAATIMAASIPVLRVFFAKSKQPSSTRDALPDRYVLRRIDTSTLMQSYTCEEGRGKTMRAVLESADEVTSHSGSTLRPAISEKSSSVW